MQPTMQQELIDGAEMARRIKRMREEQRYSLAAVGRWFGVPRQTIYQAENQERSGAKINDLRAKIYRRLNPGADVHVCDFVIEQETNGSPPGLF